jgi:hypothetical protein
VDRGGLRNHQLTSGEPLTQSRVSRAVRSVQLKRPLYTSTIKSTARMRHFHFRVFGAATASSSGYRLGRAMCVGRQDTAADADVAGRRPADGCSRNPFQKHSDGTGWLFERNSGAAGMATYLARRRQSEGLVTIIAKERAEPFRRVTGHQLQSSGARTCRRFRSS